MTRMTDFEIRARNMETAIVGARHRVNEFGYLCVPTAETVSQMIGMFICWLTACEEARHQSEFRCSVIEALPEVDKSTWDTYIEPASSSSLRKRVESLWGIRIAFTHSDGNTELIKSPTNRRYAQDAPKHIPGVVLDGTRLSLASCGCHIPIRTIVQVQDVLK